MLGTRVRNAAALVVSAVAALAAAGCGSGGKAAAEAGAAPAAPAFGASAANFVDVTAACGLAFSHRNGATGKYWLPEIMGGGGALFDYDGDGNLDAYVVQSGQLQGARDVGGNRLFRGDGKLHFTDVTARAGVGGRGYGMGCAVGDADNDGDLDLFVAGFDPDILYRNNGDGTFTDVSAAAGLGEAGLSTSACFFDYDKDGLLDLYVCRYLEWRNDPRFTEKVCKGGRDRQDYCTPQSYGAPGFSKLLHNEGGLRFKDVTKASGISAKPGTALGVVATDLDDDGNIDLYVANDQMASYAWMNRGDGTFTEEALTRGCALDEMGKSQAGMGVCAIDLDDDGRMDLWKVHLRRECHALYMNQGRFFEDRATLTGLAGLTRAKTGFGTGVFDADLDGLLDIFVACGRVELVADALESSDPYAEINQFLRQTSPGRFADATRDAGPGMALVENSRGAAFGDLDNDGLIDVLIVNNNGPARVLHNASARKGSFLGLRVKDSHGRDAYHARVKAFVGGRTRTAEVRSDYSYCAANDPRVHFGLGSARRVDRVEVRWVGGGTESFGPFDVDRYVVVEQGKGAPVK